MFVAGLRFAYSLKCADMLCRNGLYGLLTLLPNIQLICLLCCGFRKGKLPYVVVTLLSASKD